MGLDGGRYASKQQAYILIEVRVTEEEGRLANIIRNRIQYVGTITDTNDIAGIRR